MNGRLASDAVLMFNQRHLSIVDGEGVEIPLIVVDVIGMDADCPVYSAVVWAPDSATGIEWRTVRHKDIVYDVHDGHN